MRGALKYNLLKGVGGWSPAQLDAYMASLTDGLFFDFTKTDRHFQENTGQTLADDVGEAIGLALDQRTWAGKTLAELIAAAPEMITNGDFSVGTGWSNNSGWAITGGQLVATATAAFSGSSQNEAFTAGRLYRVVFDVVVTAGGVRPVFLNGSQTTGTLRSASGTYTEYLLAQTGNTSIQMQAGSGGFTGAIDNVSIKEIAGNHGIQATGTLKGVRQTTGDKFDGSDDNNLTPYLAGSGNNFMVGLVTVPASLGGTQVICGAVDGSANNFYFGFTTAGLLRVGVGNTPATAGLADQRGQEIVVGISTDGAIWRAFEGPQQAGADTALGGASPVSGVPFRLGAFNVNGSAGNWFAGSIKKFVAGRDHLTLARYQQIRSALLAA